jgi:hypothetical protein
VDTPLGPTSISWQITSDGDLVAELEVPFGSSGEFRAPVGASSEVLQNGMTADSWIELGPGRHRLTVTNPLIAAAAS